MSLLELAAMPRRLPPGCIEDADRHGNVRIYYRAKGRPKVRLRGMPWTPEFMAEYETANGEAAPSKKSGIATGTWRWLCVRYFAECADFKRLDDRTQRVRRAILEGTFDEPIAPGSPRLFRDFPLSLMTPDAVEVLRDRKIATPEAANSRVKAMRQVFKWGMKKKWADGKPYAPKQPRSRSQLLQVKFNRLPYLEHRRGSAVRAEARDRNQGPTCAGAPFVYGAAAG